MANLQDVKNAINNYYLMADKYVVDIMLATVISNRLTHSSKPVWMLLLGSSSSGKTALLQLLDDIGPWIVTVDTLTTNTFASGFKSVEEASLLNKANGGIIVFKDFTTLTSMNEEGLREIMGQLRAIYDGSFNKKTGAGKNVDWVGKVGVVAGGTIAVQRKLRQFSEQGERFINYVLIQPDRVDMTKRAIENQKDAKVKEKELQQLVAGYVNDVLNRSSMVEVELPEEFKDDLIQISNFCTLARSPVILNRKTGKVEWVPEPEMPARMATMFTNLGLTLCLMNEDGELSDNNKKAIYKTAFDSIPAERRLLLKTLTYYARATTKNIAIKLDYPTETVRNWLTQINALKMIDRTGQAGAKGDMWQLREEFRKIVAKFDDAEIREVELEVTEEEEMAHGSATADNEYDEYDEGILNRINQEAQEIDWGGF